MSIVENSVPEKYQNVGLVEMLKNRRVTTKSVTSMNKTDFAPGDTVRIRVTDDGYVNWQTAFFRWKYSATYPGVGTLRNTPHAESAFRQVLIEFEKASQPIELINNRDVLANGFMRHTAGADAMRSERGVMANVEFNPDGTTMSGKEVTTAAAGPAAISVATLSQIGFMDSAGLLPMKYMGQMTWTIELQSAANLYESTDAYDAGTYKLEDFELVYESVQFSDEFDSVIKEKIASPEGLNILYDTYTSQSDNSHNDNTTSKLSIASSSLKGIYTLGRPQNTVDAAVVGNTTAIGGHNYRFAIPTVVDYQYKANGKLYPSFRADVDKYAYCELLRSLNKHGDIAVGSLVSHLVPPGADATKLLNVYNSGALAAANAETGSLMFGVSFEEHGGEKLRSGLDTKGSLDVEFTMRRTAGAGVAVVLNHFLHVDRIMKILPNNEIEIIS
jgi:hypothetical protein